MVILGGATALACGRIVVVTRSRGSASDRGHRARVWLYHRFALSLRDVQELMVARGVVVSYETIRSWCAKFGPNYGNRLRRRRARPGDKWHLDEVFVRIRGPRVVVRDKLASYQVAAREVLPSVIHRRWKYLNNRAENSHQPTRIREWVMKRFASPGQAQRFLFAFSHVREQFRPRGHLMSAPQWRTEMNDRFAVWDEIITTEAA